jgi:Mg-chelatase subunit ChlD
VQLISAISSENKTTEEFRHSLDLIKTHGGTTYIVKALKQVTELLNNHTANHKVLTIIVTDGYVHDDPNEGLFSFSMMDCLVLWEQEIVRLPDDLCGQPV